jgi:transcriptional regulator with XRE-family HTH domain
MYEDTQKRKPTLEELRVAAGMSRAQLAHGAGFKEGSTIYDIERKGAMPKLDKAVGLARALKMPLRVVCESIGLDLSGIPCDSPCEDESA